MVESEDPEEWAKAIAGVRQKERSDRLQDIQQLRSSYDEKFSWEKQCDNLVEKMWDIIHGENVLNILSVLGGYSAFGFLSTVTESMNAKKMLKPK